MAQENPNAPGSGISSTGQKALSAPSTTVPAMATDTSAAAPPMYPRRRSRRLARSTTWHSPGSSGTIVAETLCAFCSMNFLPPVARRTAACHPPTGSSIICPSVWRMTPNTSSVSK